MKALKIAGIVLLVLIGVIAAIYFYARYRLSHVRDYGNLEASLDKAAQKLMAADPQRAVVVGVYKAGRSLIKGYGSSVKGAATPPDSSSIFELASTSKLFTTSLLKILCEHGIVRLDDKIADLLRDHIVLPPAAAAITLRHLATHTSGFPSLPQSFLEKMQDEANPYKDLKTQDLYDYLKGCAGKKPEGAFEYSNFGMGLLGHILALKAGCGYEEAVQREILRPLGMSHTFVAIDSSLADNIVQGYNEAGAPAPVWTDNVLTGAGSFLSNASDMLLFIRANVDKAHLLYPVLAKTHLPQPGGAGGLGWMRSDGLDKFLGNKDILWHNGMAGGYASYIAIDTAADAGIIVLSNKAADVTGDGSMLMRTVTTQSWKR